MKLCTNTLIMCICIMSLYIRILKFTSDNNEHCHKMIHSYVCVV